MTVNAKSAPADRARRTIHINPAWFAVLGTLLAAIAFAVIQPEVNDLWAARAREAAARDDVGLHYWFSWFSGMVPGNYSVLLPYAYRVIDPVALGTAATVIGAALSVILLRRSRRPMVASYVAALALVANLWSGRIPFVIGMTLVVGTLIAVQHRRWIPAVCGGIVAGLVTPVAGAFFALGLVGLVLHDRSRRWLAVVAIGTSGICLLALGWYFGMPGPQGFAAHWLALTLAGGAVLLAARPPDYVRSVLIIALVICVAVAVIPNGLGSNFGRFLWACMPVAVVATGRAPTWRTVTASCAALAILIGYTTLDLVFAGDRTTPLNSYAALSVTLTESADTANFRVETVKDGTHNAAYALLPSVQLANGWETQAANEYNGILDSPDLDAHSYRTWLDENAVGYVAITHEPRIRSAEYDLVATNTPNYLTEIWSNSRWTLYEVDHAVPIAARPAVVTHASQAAITVKVPSAGRYELRVRWSRFLYVDSDHAHVEDDGSGWTVLIADSPGSFVVTA